jgi:hypothetical protein
MDRQLVTWGQRLKIKDLMGLMTRWDRRVVGIEDSEARWGQVRLGIEDSGTKTRWGWHWRLGCWDRRLRIKDSFGSKTRWDRIRLGVIDSGTDTRRDRRLGCFGIKDPVWKNCLDRRLVGIEDSLGTKTGDQRQGSLDSKTPWDRRLEIKDSLWSKTRDRRLVGIEDLGSKTRDQWLGINNSLGLMTRRLVGIKDLVGTKNWRLVGIK